MSDAVDKVLARLQDICTREVAPRAAAAEVAGAPDPAAWAAIKASGYLGLFHGPEVGGLGADAPRLVQAMEMLATACPGTYWAATASTLLCARAITALGRREHLARWAHPVMRGEKWGCFAVTEPGPASDPASYRTVLQPDGEDFRLVGQKRFITNAPVAEVGVVLALVLEAGGPPKTAFAFVDLTHPKVTRTVVQGVGLRAMGWGHLGFDGVPVSRDDVWVGELSMLVNRLAFGQLLITYAALGAARGALRAAATHLAERRAYGRPLAELAAPQAKLGELTAVLATMRRLGATAAERLLADAPDAVQSAWVSKLAATEGAVGITRGALELFGASGLEAHAPVARFHRDALTALHGGMANDRIRDLMSAALLQVPPATGALPPFDVRELAGGLAMPAYRTPL